jgi:hypothetical protein
MSSNPILHLRLLTKFVETLSEKVDAVTKRLDGIDTRVALLRKKSHTHPRRGEVTREYLNEIRCRIEEVERLLDADDWPLNNTE